MSLKFVYGASASGKSQKLYEEVLSEASKCLNKRYVFIVPEQYALSVEKNLVDKSEGHGIINIEVLSFSRLSYRIMEEAGDVVLPKLNDVGKTVLLRNIIEEKDSELRLYKSKKNNLGFLDELKSMISEMSQYLIAPDFVKAASDSAPENTLMKLKLSELSVIYSEYNKRLSEMGFTTAENIIELCFKHITDSEFLSGTTLVFDGFTGFTPIQYEFIERLMMKNCDFIFSLTGDDGIFMPYKRESDRGRDLFAMSHEMADKLIRLSEKNGIKTEVAVRTGYVSGTDAIENLKNNIFRNKKVVFPDAEGLSIYSLYDKKEETHFVAAKISELLRIKGYKYSDIAVVTGDIDGYAPFFSEQLDKYGIPYFMDRDVSISSNPLVLLLVNAINTVTMNFEPSFVCSLIKSPLLDMDFDKRCQFENYLISKGYFGLSMYKKEWEAAYRGQNYIDMEAVNEVREYVYGILSPLLPVRKATSVDVIINSVFDFFEECDVQSGLMRLCDKLSGLDIKDSLLLQREYERVLEAVKELMLQIGELLDGRVCSLKEFFDIFTAGIGKLKLGFVPKQDDVVTVGDVWRTRLSGIKVLFFIGVNEGVVPRVNKSSGLLTSDDRSFLNSFGLELAVEPKDDPMREKFYIYLTMAKPADSLYFTYERIDENSFGNSFNEKRPSAFITDIQKMFPALLVKTASDFDTDEIISFKLGFDRGLSYVSESSFSEPADAALYDSLKNYYSEDSSLFEYVDSVMKFSMTEAFSAISEEVAKDLYNGFITGSVTRIETYKGCAFRYFMNYGLRLDKRRTPEPDIYDYGNVIHQAFKDFMGAFITSVRLNEGKISENDLPDFGPEVNEAMLSFAEATKGMSLKEIYEEHKEDYHAFAGVCLEKALDEVGDMVYRQDARLDSISSRMHKPVNAVADTQVNAMCKSGFEPDKLEYSITVRGQGVNSLITGTVDRVDVAETDDNLYIKVIDYKTGEKAFNPTDFLNGTQIQLPLYTNLLLKQDYSGCIPTAAVYQPMKFKDIRDDGSFEDKSGDDDSLCAEEIVAKRNEALKQNGIFNSDEASVKEYDPDIENTIDSEFGNLKLKNGKLFASSGSVLCDNEQIEIFGEYAERVVNDSIKEMFEGVTAINPLIEKSKDTPDSCDNCPYDGICGQDRRIPTYTSQLRQYETFKAPKGMSDAEAIIIEINRMFEEPEETDDPEDYDEGDDENE